MSREFPDAGIVAAFNVRDAARYVGLGLTRMHELIGAGEIRVVRCGRRIIVARAELDRWLAGYLRGEIECESYEDE